MPCLDPYLESDFEYIPGAFVVPEIAGAYHANSPRVLVVTVDARVLSDARDTFLSMSRNPEAVAISGCVQVPEAIVTLLMLLLHLIANPSLCRPDDVEANIKNASKYLSRDGKYIPRVDFYHELLKSDPHSNEARVILAHRFFLHILDKGMDVNYGADNRIAMNAKMKEYKPKPEEPLYHPAYALICGIKTKMQVSHFDYNN
jgi:hypothetical protein